MTSVKFRAESGRLPDDRIKFIKAEFTLINELSENNKLPNLCIAINGLDLQKKKYGYYYGYGKYGKYYGYGKRYGYGYGYGEKHTSREGK